MSINEILKRYTVNELVESELSNLDFVYQFRNIEEAKIDMKYWDKCADVLISRGHERIKDVEIYMLHWLEDLNWIGSIKIFNYFLSLDINELKDAWIFVFDESYLTNDLDFSINLCNLLINRKDYSVITDSIKDNKYLSEYLKKILNEKF